MISIEDIMKAQDKWGAAVVAVGRLKNERAACEVAAAEAVDRLYAFDTSEVLFKPTRAAVVPFRNSRRGALSYFIGGDDEYPEDNGFAMVPWVKVRFENAHHHLQGNRACAMGSYFFTDAAGDELRVEYTLGYLEDENGALRICLHHSSMPYEKIV